ncbi:uncharacterized protein LOC132040756 [Lycium ferocissimum]|uniref:uncharacterized protein LOC132040756 n=1 Tax=Lycium ferocissimum TaxID=112874 RepID=UPI0028161F3B|nr:uncharacterized protein LOC132040756 [Lycium ferocissimum]
MVNLGFHLASPLYTALTKASIIVFSIVSWSKARNSFIFWDSHKFTSMVASLKDDHGLAQSELNFPCLKMKECNSQISSILKEERGNRVKFIMVLANHARIYRQVP